MEYENMVNTIEGARDAMRTLALGGDNVRDELWMHVQALDHLLEEAAKPSEVAEIAAKFIHNGAHRLGFYVGAMKSLTARHQWLDHPYAPVGVHAPLVNQLADAGRDLWMVWNMIKQQEKDYETNDKRTESTGCTGEGRPS